MSARIETPVSPLRGWFSNLRAAAETGLRQSVFGGAPNAAAAQVVARPNGEVLVSRQGRRPAPWEEALRSSAFAGTRWVDLVFAPGAFVAFEFDAEDAPLAELRGAVELEVLMRSPFTEEAGRTAWRATRGPNGRWRVQAAATSAAMADEALTKLRSVGWRVNTVRFASLGRAADVLVAAPEWAAAPRRPSVFAFLTAGACAAAFLFSAGWAYWTAAQAKDAAQARAAISQRAAAAALADRKVATALSDAAEASSRRLAVLGALAKATPDSAYLERLEIDGDELRVTGVATSAAGVLRRLDAVDLLSEPRFSAPVRAASEDDKERFGLTAQVRAAAAEYDLGGGGRAQ